MVGEPLVMAAQQDDLGHRRAIAPAPDPGQDPAQVVKVVLDADQRADVTAGGQFRQPHRDAPHLDELRSQLVRHDRMRVAPLHRPRDGEREQAHPLQLGQRVDRGEHRHDRGPQARRPRKFCRSSAVSTAGIAPKATRKATTNAPKRNARSPRLSRRPPTADASPVNWLIG